MSNRISQNLVTVEVRTIMQMKITIPIITIIMKKKHETKQTSMNHHRKQHIQTLDWL